MSVMELIIKAQDQASEVFQNIQGNAEQSSNWMERNWLKVGAGAAVAGGAMMKLTGHSQQLNEVTRSVAIRTGESEEELRNMAQAMSDASLSNEEINRAMDTLIQRGVDSKDQFEELIPVMDDYADATGKDIAESIEQFDNVLGALGIPLEEAGDHMDTFTHITEQTDIPLGTLQRNLGRVPDELDKLDFSLDEATAGIEYFRDQGYTGQEAVREFRRAVEESDGDLEAFKEQTGMTSDEFDKYIGKIEESEGLTQELADANNESLTIWDDLKARLDDAMWSMGSFLEPVQDLGPLMMGVGPLMKGVGTIMSGSFLKGMMAATKATWSFTTALLANPIVWKIGLIVALVAGLYMLWRNWDSISDWFSGKWEEVGERVSAVVDRVVDFVAQLPGRIWEWLQNTISRFIEWRSDMRDRAIEAGSQLLDGFIGVVSDLPGQLWDILMNAVGKLGDIGGRMWEGAKDLGGNIWGGFKNALGISSPSYLEEAMDNIMHKGDEMRDALKGDFGEVDGLHANMDVNGGREGVSDFSAIEQRLDIIIRLLMRMIKEGIKIDPGDLPFKDIHALADDIGKKFNEGGKRAPARVRLSSVD